MSSKCLFLCFSFVFSGSCAVVAMDGTGVNSSQGDDDLVLPKSSVFRRLFEKPECENSDEDEKILEKENKDRLDTDNEKILAQENQDVSDDEDEKILKKENQDVLDTENEKVLEQEPQKKLDTLFSSISVSVFGSCVDGDGCVMGIFGDDINKRFEECLKNDPWWQAEMKRTEAARNKEMEEEQKRIKERELDMQSSKFVKEFQKKGIKPINFKIYHDPMPENKGNS